MSTTLTPEADSFSAHQAPYFDRVRERTPPRINRQIDRRTAGNLDRLLSGDPAEVARRLDQLDREWDVDRAVMATFAVVGGANWLFSVRRWLAGRPPGRSALLFGIQLAFLFHHARAGWCPPVSLLRRLGFRTRMEIEEERRVLLAMLTRPQMSQSMLVIASD